MVVSQDDVVIDVMEDGVLEVHTLVVRDAELVVIEIVDVVTATEVVVTVIGRTPDEVEPLPDKLLV